MIVLIQRNLRKNPKSNYPDALIWTSHTRCTAELSAPKDWLPWVDSSAPKKWSCFCFQIQPHVPYFNLSTQAEEQVVNCVEEGAGNPFWRAKFEALKCAAHALRGRPGASLVPLVFISEFELDAVNWFSNLTGSLPAL